MLIASHLSCAKWLTQFNFWAINSQNAILCLLCGSHEPQVHWTAKACTHIALVPPSHFDTHWTAINPHVFLLSIWQSEHCFLGLCLTSSVSAVCCILQSCSSLFWAGPIVLTSALFPSGRQLNELSSTLESCFCGKIDCLQHSLSRVYISMSFTVARNKVS